MEAFERLNRLLFFSLINKMMKFHFSLVYWLYFMIISCIHNHVFERNVLITIKIFCDISTKRRYVFPRNSNIIIYLIHSGATMALLI